ncbi:MAG TPA: prepilin-type N-terminal cleavage/methylation domain-containing protein [Pyrinomonadaceae bacterium]|jgi:prepilin-type N-terminal cleavage/methylation domain-containing protein|nr:prepilin-type N-terminal cleavage/methylation domain-containing protein [Pyrinomonadaceae bacterium]
MNKQTSQRGFSLIELMIAMTVTVVIAGIASTLVAQSFRMRAREDARSDAIADAQRALNIVSREIANSGFGIVDNGLVLGDTGPNSIRFRANLNAYTRDSSGNPVPGAGVVGIVDEAADIIDADEDIKYSMYIDDAANRHYLVRYDVSLGGRRGTTVLANRLDTFHIDYFDANGNSLDLATYPDDARIVWKVRLTVGVVLPAEGVPGSPGYQPESTINLISDVVLRNTAQITY